MIPADYFQEHCESCPVSRCVRLMIAPRSEATNALRKRIKDELEDQIWDFFTVQGGQVVIYDANNSNVKSRRECLDKFEPRGVHVIFMGEFVIKLGRNRIDECREFV